MPVITTIKLRRDTAANWTTANPILAAGEAGLETDTDLIKYGDGVTAWASLRYPATSRVSQAAKNDTGANTTKGRAVYISGANGSNALFSLADADAETTSSKTVGLLAQNLAANEIGLIITDGLLSGIDTSAATVGQSVWLSGTSGGRVYGNPPAKPAHGVYLGVVTRAHATQGEILVKIQNGYELNELHDVNAGSPADNNILAYDSATSMWTNQTASQAGLETTTGSQAKADAAQSAAISAAATDATTKANAAKSGAETTAAAALAAHEADTTSVHGIADTAALATKTYADSAVTTAVAGLTKASVGLGNVDNTSDANKPVSTATQTALDAKATIAALSAHESDTTNIHGIADTSLLATKSYADTAAANAAAAIVDSAPGALNTLNELAAAINDDASFAATVTTALGNKQDKVSGVSDTEIGYLDGVTSAIQTQLNAKAAISHTHAIADTTGLQTALDGKAASTHTHTQSDITGLSATLTAKQDKITGVSDTEIGYLANVTSDIQDQINAAKNWRGAFVYGTAANYAAGDVVSFDASDGSSQLWMCHTSYSYDGTNDTPHQSQSTNWKLISNQLIANMHLINNGDMLAWSAEAQAFGPVAPPSGGGSADPATPTTLGTVYGLTEVDNTGNVSLGHGVTGGNTGSSNVSIGNNSITSYSSNTAVGHGASTTDTGSSAFGFYSKAAGSFSTALGNASDVKAGANYSIAIGNAVVDLNSEVSIAIGSEATIGGGAIASTAIGSGASITGGASSSVAIGNNSHITSSSTGAIAIGQVASSGADYAIAIGTQSIANYPNGIAIGQYANANMFNTVAIGSNTYADYDKAIAIGYGAYATNAVDYMGSQIVIGTNSNTQLKIPGVGIDTGAAQNGQVLVWNSTAGYYGTGAFEWQAPSSGGFHPFFLLGS
jgi:hypothetical protein